MEIRLFLVIIAGWLALGIGFMLMIGKMFKMGDSMDLYYKNRCKLCGHPCDKDWCCQEHEWAMRGE